MMLRIPYSSDQAQQTQDGKYDDHEADEIDNAAHFDAPSYSD